MSVWVTSEKPLRAFAAKHPNAAVPLSAWKKLMRGGTFRNPVELKRTFGSVDMVPVKGHDFYVFDIGGNKYRLVAAIHFNTQKLFVRHVLTHADYDTGAWKK
jgi:mRNA interferase HigB